MESAMTDVSTRIPELAAMIDHWSLVDALKGGTRSMRDAGKSYLPAFPHEDEDSYANRLKAATLLPAYAETVQQMAGRVFAAASAGTGRA